MKSSTYDYVITLKKTDPRVTDFVSLLMYVFTLLVFGYYYFQYRHPFYVYVWLGIAVTLLVTLKKKHNRGMAYFRLGLLIAAVGWLYAPTRNIFMAALYILAALLEKQVKFPAEAGFSDNEIVFNTFPRKKIKWSEVNNVLIKEGILTVDQKNNQLLQKEIEGEVTRQTEDEFNAYCKKHINREQPN